MNEAPEAEIDVGERASRLQGEGVRPFVNSWEGLLGRMTEKGAAKKEEIATGPLSI
jgi:hypothetical protein